MDFSKGAMSCFAALGQFAETGADGGWRCWCDDESQQTPTSLSDRRCFIGDGAGRSVSSANEDTLLVLVGSVSGGGGGGVSHIRVILLDNFTSACDVGVAVTYTLMRASHW